MLTRILFLIVFLTLTTSCLAQNAGTSSSGKVLPGAYHMEEYLPILKGKKVALMVNQTAEVNGILLPDTLLRLGVNLVRIFSPEHGFRGKADAGAAVQNSEDPITGLPVISLYGNHKKPTAAQLKDVDIMIYDLQDVGVRFYTYISSLEYLMEACASEGIPLLILDRPNPLGFIVDGPVLDRNFSSFVGMQPIPVIYGMTPGEYANMLIGEQWISPSNVDLSVIKCSDYTHSSLYNLPVPPSPNLKTMAAVYLYPSLCFFEGTPVSVGRGTTLPFQQFGHPLLKNYTYQFTPKSMSGSTNPPLKGQVCQGLLIAEHAEDALKLIDGKLQLGWLIDAYKNFPEKDQFFTTFFEKLAGTDLLRKQIVKGLSEKEIRTSWEPALQAFRLIRSKYLLYEE